MNTLHESRRFLYSAVPLFPVKVRGLFTFGLEILALQRIVSLRANARLVSSNWYSAKCKAWRLTRNARLAEFFPTLVGHWGMVLADDVICVDFSDFGNSFQVLTFAKQTRQGRALPLYFEILPYPVQKGSQNLFVLAAIQHFSNLVGFQPALVFDRGFAAPTIIQFLQENQYPFVVRVKGIKRIRTGNGREIKARDMKRTDARVHVYENNLRYIQSDLVAGCREPWYLITNLFQETREGIIDIYYHRFEIEEFFRDAKRLLGLEWITFKTARSLSLTLWFVILGTWCLSHLAQLLTRVQESQRVKLKLSRIRYVFELLQSQKHTPHIFSPFLWHALPVYK